MMGFAQTLFIACFVARFCSGTFYGNGTWNGTSSSSSYSVPSSMEHSSSTSLSSIDDSSSESGSSSESASSTHQSSSFNVPRQSSYSVPSNGSLPGYGPTNNYASSTGYSSGSIVRPSHSFYPSIPLNSSSARVTGTGGLPPYGTGLSFPGTGYGTGNMPAYGTGHSSYGTGFGTDRSNATRIPPKWSNATMTAAPPGFAIYGNSTFRTNCPHKSAYHSTDCYATCTKLADRCWSEWYTWSQGNNAYQASMVEQNGVVSVPEKTLYYTFPESTVLTYWTTMTAVPEYYTQIGITSTVGTYTVARDDCEILSAVESDGTTNTQYVNTCASSEQSTVTTVINEIHPTTSTVISTGTYVLSSSIVSVRPASTSTTIRSTISEYKGFASPAPTCSFTNCMPPKNCGTCTISGGHVELLYWPVPASPTASPSGIFQNASVPASVTAPATMVVEGVTITSPSVAISFETAYAMNDCNKTIGAAHTGSIIVLPPGDVSSLLMGGGVGGMPGQTYVRDGTTQVGPYFAAVPLNYADLNWPYPLSAWLQQPRCHGYPGSCDYVVSGELKPILAAPDQLRTLDPAWASCGFEFGGLYDPPIALTPSQTIVKPTVGGSESTTKPAAPEETPASPPASTKASNAAPVETSESPIQYSDQPVDQGTSNARVATSKTETVAIVTVGTGSSAATIWPGSSTGQVVVDSGDSQTTLDPGAVTTINNTPLEVDSTGNVIVDVSSTESVQPAPTPTQLATVGTNIVDSNPSGSGVIINSEATLIPGQITTVDQGDGTLATISIDPSNSVVIQTGTNSPTTVGVPSSTPQVVAGQTVSSDSNGGVVLGGSTTLSAGGPAATSDGTVFSVASDGGLVVNSRSTASRNNVQHTDPVAGLISAVLNVAGDNSDGHTSIFTGDSGTFTATQASDGSNNVVIEGASTTLTLIPGESGLVDGQIVRVDSTGGFVAGTSTQLDQKQVTTSASGAVILVTAGTFEAGGSTLTAIQQGGTSQGVIIDGTTLSVGEALTTAGKTISLSPTGLLEIGADGSTSTISLVPSETTIAPSTEVEALLTLSHAGTEEILTAYQLASERGVVELDGHSLSVGGEALTTAGVTISLAPGGQLVTRSAGETGWDTIRFASVTQTRPGLPSRFGAWATRTPSSSLATASAGQSVSVAEAGPTSSPNGAIGHRPSAIAMMAAVLLFSVLML